MTLFADISNNNGNVDVKLLKDAGYAGVVCKATEGLGFVDRFFTHNWQETQALGLTCGAYHFGHPSNSPQAEAAHFLKVAIPAGEFDFFALDIEATGGKSPGSVAAWTRTFCEYVRQAFPDKPLVIYTSLSFVDTNLRLPVLGQYPLWVADYFNDQSTNHVLSLPAPWPRASMWQYTSSRQVNGVGAVDTSLVYDWFLQTLHGLAPAAPVATPEMSPLLWL